MKRNLNVLMILLLGNLVFSQTPGALITTPIVSYLNPNGDSWVTSSGSAYTSNDQDESELSWVSIPQYSSEPSGDLNVGGSCGTTDIMDDPVSGADASYVLFENPDGIDNNGDELMLYRLRIARDPGSGNFGFSVLMDIDDAFGTADSDSVEGNPGFEVEIRVVNGGGSKGVHVDDVRGTTSGSNLAVYNINTHTQRSYALVQNSACSSKPAVFYDFRIPFSILSSNFGITTDTRIRLVGATSINGATVLGSTASDIAGIDDDNYANTVAGQDQAFSDFVNNQQATSAKNATNYGTLPVQLTHFDAFSFQGINQIEWITNSEIRNDYFELEYSYDGLDFYFLEMINGQGNTTEITKYTAFDYRSVDSDVYYRLKQVDFDGSFAYSDIEVVKRNKVESSVEIYPNPAVNVLTVDHLDSESSINIFDTTGKKVKSLLANGKTDVQISDLTSGWYVVNVSSASQSFSQKLMIVK